MSATTVLSEQNCLNTLIYVCTAALLSSEAKIYSQRNWCPEINKQPTRQKVSEQTIISHRTRTDLIITVIFWDINPPWLPTQTQLVRVSSKLVDRCKQECEECFHFHWLISDGILENTKLDGAHSPFLKGDTALLRENILLTEHSNKYVLLIIILQFSSLQAHLLRPTFLGCPGTSLPRRRLCSD